MGIFRSEEMGLYWLNMPREYAYDIISALGRMNSLQFIDADENDTPVFKRHFHHNVKRCEDTLLKLNEIENEIEKFELETLKCGNIQGYLTRVDQKLNQYKSQQKYYEEIESIVEKKIVFMHQLLTNFDNAVQRRNMHIEQRAVLDKATRIYNDQAQQGYQGRNSMISILSGTIDIEDAERFTRTIFRVSKGNCLTIVEEINPDTRKNQQLLNAKTRKVLRKSVFIILYSGSASDFLLQRMLRVCESFGAGVVDIPSEIMAQKQKYADVEKRISETNQLVKLNEEELDKFFREFTAIEGLEQGNAEELGACSRIESMKLTCARERLIYSQLNMLNPKNSIYAGLVWIQQSQELKIIQNLNALSNANPHMATGQLYKVENYNISPPTLIITNDFTYPFQEVVNTYGVPRYQEINPGVFTTVTFPFLFGVMFGDMGHGSVMFLFALYLLTVKPNKARPGALDGAYSYRYMILLMSVMAIFCGLIYNDFLGMSLNFFGSCYNSKTMLKNENCNYPFGLDPVWGISSNKLTIQNSLKMKMSVIFGVTQMTVGVILKGFNSIYFKSPVDFFFEFIPQLVFITSTFGYMCFMIIYKWLLDWSEDTSKAPSILTGMLKFFLNFGAIDPTTAELYEGQASIQFYLLIAALIAAPLMLFPKPIIVSMKHSKENKHGQNAQQQQASVKGGYAAQIDEELPGEQVEDKTPVCPYMQVSKPHEFSEEFVHQVIETIEFVLGCVSHTASYLRLWALSLAHSQLSEVFFTKTMIPGLSGGNPVAIIIGFVIFANITLGVLMLMDAMECFLHTLRLHWVEFQSKFYKADGYKFVPFSYINELEK